MKLEDNPEEADFRTRLKAWLAQNLPGQLSGMRQRMNDLERGRSWSRALFDAGYAGLTWPKEFGGQGAPSALEAILLEELARAGAPQHIGVIGLGMAGPTIIARGTPEQKRRYLASILNAEEIWCHGFSEPGAGSDLASLRTVAEQRGDTFVVNGQKVWSSFAQVADWCILLVRSDQQAPRYQGLTYLLLDMHSKGVEVRPLRQLTGDSDFNEIFLTDVAVPATQVVGEVGQGWGVAMTTLAHERATFGFALTGALEVAVREVLRLARERPGLARSREDVLAREWTVMQALKLTAHRQLAEAARRGGPGPEGSLIKLAWSEANQRVTKLARELAADLPVDDGHWHYLQLRSRANSIEAGTSEVLRNIVAERVLGLPRSR
ncbi:MAG: acyl-CoA dehydrogenase family protein [Candidatus Dormibacteria bacterium]